MESSIATIMCIFSFFLVFRLHNSGLQIIQLILDHLLFLGSIDIEGYIAVEYFERRILTLGIFAGVFFLTCKLHRLALYTIPYFGHG